MRITLDIRRMPITVALVATATLIIGLGVAGTVLRYVLRVDLPYTLRFMFDADREMNIPAWFATLLLAGCALMCWVIARQRTAVGGRWIGHWRVLACGFLFMSLDEMVALHEMLVTPTRNLLNTAGPAYFAWVIPAGVVVLVVGLAYLRFLVALPGGAVRRAVVAGGAIYVAGLIGVEMIGAAHYNPHGGGQPLTYLLLVSLEEYLELMGLIVFLIGCMRYWELSESAAVDVAGAQPLSSRASTHAPAGPAVRADR